MKTDPNNFSFIEVLIAVTCSGILGATLLVLLMGNFYFTSSTAIQELKAAHPEVVKVLTISRNVFHTSVITTENRDGTHQTYCLDTNILLHHDIHICKKQHRVS